MIDSWEQLAEDLPKLSMFFDNRYARLVTANMIELGRAICVEMGRLKRPTPSTVAPGWGGIKIEIFDYWLARGRVHFGSRIDISGGYLEYGYEELGVGAWWTRRQKVFWFGLEYEDKPKFTLDFEGFMAKARLHWPTHRQIAKEQENDTDNS